MRHLDVARAQARDCRSSLGLASGLEPGRAVDVIEAWLWTEHSVEIALVDAAFLRGSRGELVLEEGILYVDKRLQSSPEEMLAVVAHEVGHLLLHHRQLGPMAVDFLRGSVFLDQGAPALARYSPRSKEEAEASAFAAELICPSGQAFAAWHTAPAVALEGLAATFACSPELVQIQLAEGLYRHVVGEPSAPEADDHPVTPRQELAATTIGSPVLVDAGPGTGKTKTLVRRIQHLVEERSVPPEHILVLTFSNEAAAELRERIEAKLGEQVAARIVASTFHGFGVLLLHLAGHLAGLGVEYSIVDETLQEEIITELLGQVECDAILDLKDPGRTASEVAGLIAYLKDRLIGTDELRADIEKWVPETAEASAFRRAGALLRIFEAYERYKEEQEKVDFADLILLPHRILRNHDHLREELRKAFPWVLVDEYQDVSRATALFLGQVAGPSNPPWVVGDARQAIYRFRGADPANLNRFPTDFVGAVSFQLQDNYRSAPEIIAATNELAQLLGLSPGGSHSQEGWRPGRTVASFGDNPVRKVRANSDLAEREGIAGVVQRWLADGCRAGDIAVLARRNVDVRNIAIALKRRGVRAVTTGIITAEGAGGDLAAVLSAVDQPKSIARVLFALHRGEAPSTINPAISDLLGSDPNGEEPTWGGAPSTVALASFGWRLRRVLHSALHSLDSWSVLTKFLFFEAPYLRSLLAQSEQPEAAVQLEEILSALALAANYRFTHPHESPRRSRLGFAHSLRRLLTFPSPGLIPPRKEGNAVRVMTCHAAKGLEFPCVVVAGQSLPDLLRREASLPPSLRPDPNADLLQADSLLFVGVSRAERAVVVSHATTAGGTVRSRPRKLPQLLEKWLEAGKAPEAWAEASSASVEVSVGRVWGGTSPSRVGTYALAAGTCRVRTYVEDLLGARLRERDIPLYREFIARVRLVLREVVRRMLAGHVLPSAEVGELVDELWPPDAFADHPHLAIYRPRVRRWAEKFVQAFAASGEAAGSLLEQPLEWCDELGATAAVDLHLIARFRHPGGHQVAISLQVKARDEAPDVAWSGLLPHRRLSFSILGEEDSTLRPFVFYGDDGQLRPFRWSQRKAREALAREVGAAKGAFQNLMQGSFDGVVSDWDCDRCPSRVLCPWWIGAAVTEG
jgi:DNA helicase-2/ATP-dependent DNA helicase PcrA